MQRVLMMIIVPLIMMIFVPTYAKNELTLKDAIKIGLQNNYNIRIARNTAKISENNKGKGTAGFLPMLDLSGNYQINEVDEESNSPISFGKSNTDSWGGSISLNWMLFDGFSMFIDRKRFNDLAILGEYQAREIIENNVVSISRAYFDLVRQELLLDAAIESKNISETRLQKTKVRKDLGGVSSTDYLNAQVSFNNDKSALLNQELQVIVSRKQLNTLLGRDSGTPVNVAKNNDVLPLRWEYNDILE
ncbi:MAG: TolC family protein, partial [candidate division Zixibacteria bacterium]|nr:TolC family protein [candidate division Zixibacteria bacterium]